MSENVTPLERKGAKKIRDQPNVTIGDVSLGLHSARYLNLKKACSHLQPLAATRVAASGRFCRVAAFTK